MGAAVNPYKEYQNNQVTTADPKGLIVMLYEGAIKFLNGALSNIDDFRKYDKVNQQIIKAQDIITELMLSLDLDKGQEIAQNLLSLYVYVKKLLLEGNIKKERKPIEDAVRMLTTLKEGWDQM